jgi:hypothetical protein
MIVAALIRRTEAAGGHAAVLARGDATAGTLLVQLAERGVAGALLERMPGASGFRWTETGPAEGRADYLARRRRADPDLWIVELDHAGAREILIEVAG